MCSCSVPHWKVTLFLYQVLVLFSKWCLKHFKNISTQNIPPLPAEKEKKERGKYQFIRQLAALSCFKDKLNAKKNTPHFTDWDISCRKVKYKEELWSQPSQPSPQNQSWPTVLCTWHFCSLQISKLLGKAIVILNQNLNQSIRYVPMIDLTGVSETSVLEPCP